MRQTANAVWTASALAPLAYCWPLERVKLILSFSFSPFLSSTPQKITFISLKSLSLKLERCFDCEV